MEASMMRKRNLAAILGIACLCSTACSEKSKGNGEAQVPAATAGDSGSATPSAARPQANPLKNAYFGDLHLHTGYSMDAFVFGTRTTPDDAYRYAMGEAVEYLGKKEKRLAPLDFLAVTDHAEYLGTVRETINPNGTFAGSDWYKIMTSPDPKVSGQAFKMLIGSTMANKPLPEFSDPKMLRSTWGTYAETADRYYKPGSFTTFVGYEWTSMPGGQNLHRCVIFSGKGPEMPFSAFESQDPEDLWKNLEAQRKLGLDVIAVPHNGNVSNGLMFDKKDMSGKAAHRGIRQSPHGQRTAGGNYPGQGSKRNEPSPVPER